MHELPERIYRTLLHALLENKSPEIAAVLVDGDLEIQWLDNGNLDNFTINLPLSSFNIVVNAPNFRSIIEKYLKLISQGHLYDDYDHPLELEKIKYRVKLLDVEENWKEIVKNLIINSKDANQGLITEKVFSRNNKQPLIYNEMKFGSNAEVRIAQELERKRVLFFPLPLAVKSETGILHQDHREPDFLVCFNGIWGILEVSLHSNRYEKDAEKNAWFKKSGILCVESYTAERCYNHPTVVVDEFLSILSKHKR